jgi:hypothetical protein
MVSAAAYARADEPSPLTLHWVRAEGAESCVPGAELERQLRELLADESVAPAALVIEGLVARDASDGLLHARLRVLERDGGTVGKRELLSAATDCHQFTPSIVLVLSMMVELGSRNAPAQPPSATTSRASAVAVDEELPPALQPRPDARRDTPAPPAWQLDGSAAVAVATGLNPDAGLGPTLGLRVHTPWWLTLALRAGYWPGGRTRIAHPNALLASVDFHAFEADLGLCLPVARKAPWWLASCWGGALVLRKAHMIGLVDAPDSRRVTAGASAALQLAYAVHGPWLLSFDASLLGFRRRDRYAFQGLEGERREVFRPGHFAGVLALGLAVPL